MAKYLYKYVGAGYLDKVFVSDDYVSLKCSYPKDFNDPYELFLTIDFNQEPEALAFYMDAVGRIPQLPVTCFSRSPIVTPMWAHYAQNLEGVVIEFDEEILTRLFPESRFGDVDYRDETDGSLTDMLHRAHTIGKPRYVYLLNSGVFSAAYYTKATCWRHEQERRMVISESEVKRFENRIFIDVPRDCVTGLVCGPRASPKTLQMVRDCAVKFGCNYFELKIGRSLAVPFLVDADGDSFVFNGSEIDQSVYACVSCKEPLHLEHEEQCSWCQIDHSHKIDAASRNPFRMLDHFGLLESYIDGMVEIDRKYSEKE